MNEELNSFIATEIMGWQVHPRNTVHWVKNGDTGAGYKIMGSTCCSDKFSPSSNIKDAWSVVERITTPCVGRVNGMPWSTRFAFLFNQADLWANDHDGFCLEICRLSVEAAGLSLPNTPISGLPPLSCSDGQPPIAGGAT